MSDEDKRWSEHCSPAFDRLDTDIKELGTKVEGVVADHDKRIRGLEIVNFNGWRDKIRTIADQLTLVKRLMFAVLGMLIMIIGAMIIQTVFV